MGGWLGMAWVGAKEGVEEEAGDGETAAAAADCCCTGAAVGCAAGAETAFAGACIAAGGAFAPDGNVGGGGLAAPAAVCKWLGTGLVGSSGGAFVAAAAEDAATAACGALPVQGPLSNACGAGTSGILEGAAAEALDKACGVAAGAADELLEPN